MDWLILLLFRVIGGGRGWGVNLIEQKYFFQRALDTYTLFIFYSYLGWILLLKPHYTITLLLLALLYVLFGYYKWVIRYFNSRDK